MGGNMKIGRYFSHTTPQIEELAEDISKLRDEVDALLKKLGYVARYSDGWFDELVRVEVEKKKDE